MVKKVEPATKDMLFGSQDAVEVELETLGGKIVKVKPLTLSDLSAIRKYSKGDDVEFVKGMIFRGLVEPKLTIEEVGNLRLDIVNELSSHIARVSGLTKGSMEEIKNFSDTLMKQKLSGQ